MTMLRDAPDRIVIACGRCGRRGEYTRESALRKWGDISLEDFKFRVVSMECALMRHPSGPTRCEAHLASSRHAA